MNTEIEQLRTIFTGLAKSLDNKSSLDQTVASIKQILDFVKQSHQISVQEIGKLKTPYEDAIKKIQSEMTSLSESHATTISAKVSSELKREVANLLREIDKFDALHNKIDSLKKSQPNEKNIITKTLAQIPKTKPETGDTIIEKINTSEEQIDKERVKGLEDEIQKVRSSIPRATGGGAKGFYLYVGGTKKGLAQYINLVAGSNVTITDSVVNGLHTITFVSSGGSGFTQLSATEVPNGTRTVFTFSGASAKPSFLVVDGVWMQSTTALGTVNWTWASGPKQATLTIPANDDILGVV